MSRYDNQVVEQIFDLLVSFKLDNKEYFQKNILSKNILDKMIYEQYHCIALLNILDDLKAYAVSIKRNNRNKWYKEEARKELQILSGPARKSYEEITSKNFIEDQIKTWKAMIRVLDTGEHCPHHFLAQKPEN